MQRFVSKARTLEVTKVAFLCEKAEEYGGLTIHFNEKYFITEREEKNETIYHH